jgi:hydroxymethylbilane synthase
MSIRLQSLVIGTRASRLAVWQAEWVKAQLESAHPGLTIRLERIKTSGDKILDVPLAKIGGKGLFVKEIEEALLAKTVDLAVHSMKDVPMQLPEGLDLVCVPEREDPHDALICRTAKSLDDLPKGAKVGTSSLRRQSQLLHYRPDLQIDMLRGNLDTRMRKLQDGQYEAIVLAAAGLRRLGWADSITALIPADICLPAIGQGALAIEADVTHQALGAAVAPLHHVPTAIAVSAERAFLTRLEGGCQVPIAAYATLQGNEIRLEGLIASVDGRTILRDTVIGPSSEAQLLGVRLAELLLERGGREILSQIMGMA